MKRLNCIVVLMVIGTCLAEDIPNVEDLLQIIENALGMEDSGIIVSEYIGKIQKRYEQSGKPEAYEKFVEGVKDLTECTRVNLNIDSVIQEIEVAKPTGELDVVFEKYCKGSPILKNCIANISSIIEPYLDQEENKTNKMMLTVVHRVLDVLCLKKGRYMTLFVADQGPECFHSKSSEIKECLISMAQEANIIENFFLKFDQKDCSLLMQMEDCIVKHLFTCSDLTPVNMTQSLFKAIKKLLPC